MCWQGFFSKILDDDETIKLLNSFQNATENVKCLAGMLIFCYFNNDRYILKKISESNIKQNCETKFKLFI